MKVLCELKCSAYLRCLHSHSISWLIYVIDLFEISQGFPGSPRTLVEFARLAFKTCWETFLTKLSVGLWLLHFLYL